MKVPSPPSSGSLALAVAAGVMLAGGCADPPLFEAPNARVVAVGRAADAVALLETAVRAGLVDKPEVALDALVASEPVVVSVLPGGAIVIAARVDPRALAASEAASSSRVRVLGDTWAVGRLLVRVDKNRALIAVAAPSEQATVAAVLEVMAADKAAHSVGAPASAGAPAARALPPAGELRVHVVDAAILPPGIGPVDASVRAAGDDVRATVRAPSPAKELRAALASDAPAGACGIEAGAAAVIAVPPLLLGDLGDDSFHGRVVAAVYPRAGGASDTGGVAFALAGAPRDPAALLRTIREVAGPGLVERVDGATTSLETRPPSTARDAALSVAGKADAVLTHGPRPMRASVSPELFVLTVGEGAPAIGSLGKKPCSLKALARADGGKLARVLLPALITPEAILAALVSDDPGAAVPLAGLRGIELFEIDARDDGPDAVVFEVHVRVARVTD